MADRYEEKAKAVLELGKAIYGPSFLPQPEFRHFDVEKLKSAIAAALREQDAWWPIETAPKDGTQILTWGRLHDDGGIDMGEQPRVRVSNWSPTYNCWYSACSGSHAPTFWRPLPAPPPDTGRDTG